MAYCSPEILSQQKHNFKADVWSMGIVLYELLTGSFPFLWDLRDGSNSKITATNYKISNLRWASVSAQAKDLIKRMLRKDQELRIDSSLLL